MGVKTVDAQSLGCHAAGLLSQASAEESAVIGRRVKSTVPPIPESSAGPNQVDWACAPEVIRDRSGENVLTAQESSNLVHAAASQW
jgi:hypothetical protein